MVSATALSMADHLREQEYSRLNRSSSVLLVERRVPEEAAERLMKLYDRNDATPNEYLAMVQAESPLIPPVSHHAAVVDSGTYCAATSVPVILKDFLENHRNAVVKEVLSDHGVAMVEKVPSGGVLVRVRSADIEEKLVGEQVYLMGRRFTIKRQSCFQSKFYLDVSGIHSSDEADHLFLALCELGARPFFLTPRDVNMETEVATPTWRFYFGSDRAPTCLMVHGFVTNQLMFGGSFYMARGKHATPPPARATSYRKAAYAVELPVVEHSTPSSSARRSDPNQPRQHVEDTSALTRTNQNESSSRSLTTAVSSAIMTLDGENSRAFSELTGMEPPNRGEDNATIPEPPDQGVQAGAPDPVPTPAETADDWQTQSSQQPPLGEAMHFAAGFKRNADSFADENPYAALDLFDCDVEIVTPDIPDKYTPGPLIMPHVIHKNVNGVEGPLPTKKRDISASEQSDDDLLIEEALMVSEHQTRLLLQEDRVADNIHHYPAVAHQLRDSKNMDSIISSLCSLPLAWSMAWHMAMILLMVESRSKNLQTFICGIVFSLRKLKTGPRHPFMIGY